MAGLIVLALITGEKSLTGMLVTAGTAQESSLYLVAMLLVVAGAFAKSAQVPLHFWLPNAMEAPTPVSAYLHSATMVKAGVYLLARMTPILGDTEPWFWILTLFGGANAFAGQRSGRSTDRSQADAGLHHSGFARPSGHAHRVRHQGGHSRRAAYLCAHSLFKGSLFMIAGTIDHGTGTRDITLLGGLREAMRSPLSRPFWPAFPWQVSPSPSAFWPRRKCIWR